MEAGGSAGMATIDLCLEEGKLSAMDLSGVLISSVPAAEHDSSLKGPLPALASSSSSGGVQAACKQLSAAFLATAGLTVTFKDLSYSVPGSRRRGGQVTLLEGVSAYLRPGELSALMGPSGSGKSTLLDLLLRRLTQGTVNGEVRFAGVKPTRRFLRRFAAYVEQEDTLLDNLTVEEMLRYTADLKRPLHQSQAEKRAAVEELLHRLALASCRNVSIGSALARGISGGQAKRVNIGIALISSPRVLFLDEPVSGLDSYTAHEVMQVVKGLAQGGITVVATIHSPTPATFDLFDRLLLILKGRTVYFGASGDAAVEYFQRQCPSFPALRKGQNAAEWITSLTMEQAVREGGAGELAAAYAASDLRRIADSEIKQQLQQALDLSPEDAAALAVRQETVTPFWWGLWTLLKYRTLRQYRTPEFLGPRIGDKLVFSLVIFTLYWHVGEDLSPTNIPNIVSTLFLWTVLAAFGAMAYLPALLLERPLFVRERSDGLYRVITYLCAKMVEELGMAVLTSLSFSALVFFTLKLQGEWVLFWLVYLCSLAIGIVLAYFIAAISPTMDIANVVMPTYTTCLLFFTGLLLRWDDIPNYWRWAGYADFLRYSTGALMVNQFEGDRDVPFFQGPPGTPPVSVLEYYSLEGVSKWGWLGIQASFFLAFFLGAFLSLSYIRYAKR